MVQQNVILNMTPGPNRPTVNVSQYDTGARVLVFHLRQDGESFTPPDGCTAIIHGIKPDETYFSYTAEIDGDTVIADCTEQMTAVPGFAECEIKITNTEGRVGSCNFRLLVEKSPETGAIISDTDIPVFEQLATRAEQAAASALFAEQGATESAEAAAESASAAATSETNAAASATAASTSAEEAGASATAAAESASSASGSEASARGFAEQAEQSAGEASTSAQGAAQDAQTASDKASEAAASADRASDSAVDSANAANLASGYADTARQQAQAAEGSATDAAGSASTATTAAATATTKAGEASNSATAANTSAGQAASSASAASGSAEQASDSATAAATSAGEASDSATAAAGSASDASDSADSAAASASAAAGSAADIAASAAQIQINTDNIAALQIVESTSEADITSIDDGADGVPMKSLKVYIEPVQDLHGQDAPYPPGGGKNLLDSSSVSSTSGAGITVTVTKNATGQVTKINFQGTASSNIAFAIGTATLTAGSYVFNAVETGGTLSSIYANYSGIVNASSSATSATLSETKTTTCAVQILSGATVNTDFYPMIRKSTDDATFAPYSNICPISGWDSVETVRTGVNIWDEEWATGYWGNGEVVAGTSVRSFGKIPIKPGETYYVNTDIYYTFYDIDGTFLPISGYDAQGRFYTTGGVITSPIGAYYMTFNKPSSYGTTYNHDISINYPSTDTDYHPYEGETITTDLPSTVYGGVLDVISGVLTIDRAMVTKPHTSNVVRHSATGLYFAVFAISPAGHGTGSSYPLMSNIGYSTVQSVILGNIYLAGSASTTTLVYVMHNQSLTTIADVNQFIDENDVSFVYPLATSAAYTLTPEEVKTLLKANNVFADAGQTAIVYVADPKTYIDNSIADAVASLT